MDTFILDPLPDPRADLFCVIRNYKIDRHDGLLLGFGSERQRRGLQRLFEDPLIIALLGRAGIAAMGEVSEGIFDNARSIRGLDPNG